MVVSFSEYLERQINEFEVSEGHVQPSQVRFLQSIVEQNPSIQVIVETGFNGGHSSAAFLSVRPNLTVLSFDLGRWDYVQKAKSLIDTCYPGQHALVIGDSTHTIPSTIKYCPPKKVDLLFIDGGHFGQVPLKDVQHLIPWAKSDALIIMDDTNYPHVAAAWSYLISIGAIEDIESFTSQEDQRQWALGRISTKATEQAEVLQGFSNGSGT